MKKFLLFTFLIINFCGSAFSQNHNTETDPKIDNFLEKLIKESETLTKNDKKLSPPIPGLIAGYARAGEPIRVGAAGIRKWNDKTPISVKDLVHIGSCTKAMTATLIGILVDQGKLTFETTIAEGLPHLKDKIHEDYHNVTILQLLTHTAAVPRDTFWSDYEEKPVDERRDLLIKKALSDEPKTAPGSVFAYSNLGYCIAGRIAAYREKTTWEKLIKKEVFDKLGMNSANFGAPGTKDEVDQPWGHLAVGRKLIARQGDNPPPLGPAGTVHLTIEDWVKFAFLHAGVGDVKLLTNETLAKLHKVQIVGDAGPYACGWSVTQRNWGKGQVLTHNGSNGMWYATIWIAPKTKTVYITVANAGLAQVVMKSVDSSIGSLIELSK